MASETDKPICDVPTDGTCVSIQKMLDLKDCLIPQGACFGIQEQIVDKHGHPVDGDFKEDGSLRGDECTHTDTKEYKEEHKLKPKMIKKNKSEIKPDTDTVIDVSTDIETVAIVEIPKKDINTPEKPQNIDATLTMVMGVIGGIVGPMAINFIKNLVKNKVKKTNKEEEPEEPTDCKTHQIKSNSKLLTISKRLSSIEQKLNEPKKENDLDIDMDKISDLEERIENLEKKYLTKK